MGPRLARRLEPVAGLVTAFHSHSLVCSETFLHAECVPFPLLEPLCISLPLGRISTVCAFLAHIALHFAPAAVSAAVTGGAPLQGKSVTAFLFAPQSVHKLYMRLTGFSSGMLLHCISFCVRSFARLDSFAFYSCRLASCNASFFPYLHSSFC